MATTATDITPTTYRVGAAALEITPTWSTKMAGFAARKEPSVGTYQPLWVRTLYVDDGSGGRVLYVTADIINWDSIGSRSAGIIDQLRTAFAERHSLAAHQVIFNASHTHCGPVLEDEKFRALLIEQAQKAAAEAIGSAVEAQLHFHRGRSDVGVSRRRPDATGAAIWEINPYGWHDHEVPVLRAVTPEGRLVALLINYACHPTTIGGLYFGGDYAGFATAALEADHPGVPCLFVQGCGGDNKTDNPNPKDPLKFYTRTDDGSTQEPEKFGRRLADAVREALAGPGVPVAGPIRSKLASLELPRLICWIEEKDAAAIAEADGGEPAWSVQHPLPAARWARLARVMAASVNADGSYKKTQPAELIVLRIGDRFIHVGLPGEMTTPIGLRIKGILRGHETLVTAYTLAGIGYFPAAGQIAEGGYEVFQNFDHLPYSPEAEDVLIAKVIETIDSLAAT